MVHSSRCRCGNVRSPNRADGKGPCPRDSDGDRPSPAGSAETRAGTRLRVRLRPRSPPGSGPTGVLRTRSLRSIVRHPRLSVGAGYGHRGVLRLDRPHGPDGPGAFPGVGQTHTGAGQGVLEAGILSELGENKSTTTGTPQGRQPVSAAGRHRRVGARWASDAAMEGQRVDVEARASADTAARVCRHGGWSAMPTTSSSWSTGTGHDTHGQPRHGSLDEVAMNGTPRSDQYEDDSVEYWNRPRRDVGLPLFHLV